MLILLSPAKSLNEDRARGHASTVPRFLDEAEQLVSVARGWSEAEIAEIMKVSAAIAKLNGGRFADWTREAGPAFAAGELFDGDVYRELEFATLDEVARTEAARRLRILSGLYGLLRPTDSIRPYRLEMGRRIPGHSAGNLYRFWGSRIAEAVTEDAAALGTDTVLNLASEEYGKAVDRAALPGLRLVSPRFEEERGGVSRVIAVAAKRARGVMARWVLETGASQPEDLTEFRTGGYMFDPNASTEERPVFLRTQ
ncbi:YaaA family protein [Aliiruegeria sabulilitoris]|uniref:YaaA family protein n=1 Tax=Aliiruegeria sabulilitoris TaxID=1510458 RepID=UPI00082D1E93|nr:YaaA family protein [Aliiruegeria sabulilitoris]NDR55500.1 YaaA family protein [Pseudoruegeria sp. M32A2M]